MTQYVLNLQSISDQIFSASLGGQSCTLILDTRYQVGLFLTLEVEGQTIIAGRECVDRVPLIRKTSDSFIGDLYWRDTQGTENPQFSGFGTRWELIYDDGSS